MSENAFSFNIVSGEDLMAMEFEPADFVLPGLLAGTVGALVGRNGIGKTAFAIREAMLIASKNKKVVYFNGQDSMFKIRPYIRSTIKLFTEQERENIKKNMVILLTDGITVNLMDGKEHTEIMYHCKDSRLVIFDTLSCTHFLNENSVRDMHQLVGSMKDIAIKTGAAVLYIHYIDEPSVAGEETVRGADSLFVRPRFCALLSEMTAEEAGKYKDENNNDISAEEMGRYVKYSVIKVNYAAPIPPEWYKRDENGALFPAKIKLKSNERIIKK